MVNRYTLLFFFVLLFAASCDALAEESGEERKSFGDWGLTCVSDGGAADLCYIQQSQFLKTNKGKERFFMRLSAIVSAGRRRLVVDVPLGVDLKYGVYLQLGDGKWSRHDYSACLDGVCSVLMDVSQEELIGIAHGQSIYVKFKYFGDEKYIGFAMPMNGFSSALNKLKSVMSKQ